MTVITYIPPGADPEDRDEVLVFASKLLPDIDALLSSSLRGLEGLEAEISTVKIAGRAGERVQNVPLPPRIISDTVTVIGAGRTSFLAKKKKLIRVLNQTRGAGTLKIENENGAYEIVALPRKNGIKAGRIASRASKYEIEFFCENPYFRSCNADEAVIFKGAAPVEFPLTFPLTFSSNVVINSLNVNSEEMSTLSLSVTGPAKDIRLSINSVECSIPVTVKEGEMFRLNGDEERAYIENEEFPLGNSFVFPKLKSGINEIAISFGFASSATMATLAWVDEVLGV